MKIEPPARQNSAGRLEVLVLRGDSIKNIGAIDAWAEVFGVADETAGFERQHEVAKLLAAVAVEIKLMEMQLREAGVPDELSAPFVQQLTSAAAIGNLANSWHNIRGNHFGAELRLSLRWFKHVLPDESLAATLEDLAELESLLTELQVKAGGVGFPRSLTAFVEKQVQAIREALRQYPIGGPAALKRATRSMMADIQIDEDEIRTAAQSADPAAVAEAGDLLRKVWNKAVSIGGDVEKLSKSGQSLIEFGSAVYKMLTP